jgi:ubiquinone/menaquinone biosynthesis C-methylase UbiE
MAYRFNTTSASRAVSRQEKNGRNRSPGEGVFSRLNLALFNLGAALYDRLTTQQYWQNSVRHLSGYLRSHPTGFRILDLGCGAGVSTFALAEIYSQSQVIGVDIAVKMIEKAQHHHQVDFPQLKNIEFVVGDATRLPFPDQSFDAAVGHSFLYLIPQKAEVLREVNRVLKPNGQLILMEPNAAGSLLQTIFQRNDYLKKIRSRPGATLRFIASIVAWRIFSSFKGQFSPVLVQNLFSKAGFRQIATVPTLNGLGLYCIGFA